MADIKISELPNGQGISPSSAAATISLDGCVIGGTTPKAASFTDVSADNVFSNAIISGTGTIQIVSASALFLSTPLIAGSGGTGQTAYTSGQLLIGNSSGGLSKATLTAGANITIDNTDGGITIAATGGGGGSSAFSGLSSGTNTSAAMVVGTGASLTPGGSGSIVATSLASTLPVNQGGTGQTSYTDGELLIGNSGTGGLDKATLTAGANITITNGNGTIEIAASGSVGTSFAAITGATNTSAAMVVGTGASLSPTGSGSIVATSLASTLPVNQGGTAITSAAAYSVLCAGTTSTGGFQTVSGTGSSGQVLTSNGVSALPSWESAGGGGFPNGGYRTGSRYYFGFPFNGSTNTLVLVADRLYSRPFMVGAQATFTRIGVRISAADSGKVIRLGVYRWENGLPTSLVFDAGTVSAGSTGDAEITISQALAPGVYAFALISDGTPTVFCPGNNIQGVAALTGDAATDSSMVTRGFYYTQSYGALPANYDTAPTADNTNNVIGCWLRIA